MFVCVRAFLVYINLKAPTQYLVFGRVWWRINKYSHHTHADASHSRGDTADKTARTPLVAISLLTPEASVCGVCAVCVCDADDDEVFFPRHFPPRRR